jgi:hypothetical protein
MEIPGVPWPGLSHLGQWLQFGNLGFFAAPWRLHAALVRSMAGAGLGGGHENLRTWVIFLVNDAILLVRSTLSVG